MNKKLSSVVAALSLMASGVLPSACSDTTLLQAPERQTLPSPDDIQPTSQDVRACLGDVFRALAKPDELCPTPLEDLSVLDATEAQSENDYCMMAMPAVEAGISNDIVNMFTPYLPPHFNYGGPSDTHAELQERISEEGIPLTMAFGHTGEEASGLAPILSYLMIPGFIDAEVFEGIDEVVSAGSLIDSYLREYNIPHIIFMYHNSYLVDFLNVSTFGINGYPHENMLASQANANDGRISFEFYTPVIDVISPSFFDVSSDISLSLFTQKTVANCIERTVLMFQPEVGHSVYQIEGDSE